MRPAHAILACVLLTGGVLCTGLAVAADDAAQPAGAGLPEDVIRRLVLQLGDPDFEKREAASRRLREIGKAALPALQEAAADAHADLEMRTRAAVLARRLERRPLPGGPLDRGPRAVAQRITFDDKTITVNEGDRQFTILKEEDGGIQITVTATEEGRQVSETYSGRDEAELRELEPEAYKVYERWGRFSIPRGIELRAGQLIINGAVPVAVPDELDLLRERLEEQMRKQRVADEQAREVRAQLDRLRVARRGEVVGGLPLDPQRQIKEYFRLSDALRKTLAELKLDAGDGDALPPPPNQRLGIQITINADPFNGDIDGVRVQTVVADGRGARIGLREGDLIRMIDDTPILSTAAIREALGKAKGGVVVQVVRDGRTIKLTEKIDGK